MEFLAFTICLANGCISFLVHTLLPAMLLPVCHRGWGAYIFGRGGAGHTIDCRVWPQDHTKKTYQTECIWHKTCMFSELNICTNEMVLHSPTLWAWLDSVEGHRCTPLLLLRNNAPPNPSISSTCRRLLVLTGTKETTASKHLIKKLFRQTSTEKTELLKKYITDSVCMNTRGNKW